MNPMSIRRFLSWSLLLVLLLTAGCSTTQRVTVVCAQGSAGVELWKCHLMVGDWVLACSRDGEVWEGSVLALDREWVTIQLITTEGRVVRSQTVTLSWSDLKSLKRRQEISMDAFFAGLPVGAVLWFAWISFVLSQWI